MFNQPPLTMHSIDIMLMLLLWSWALPSAVLGQVENCTDPELTYSQEITSFGISKTLTCDISSSQTYRWWRSTIPCGPFVVVPECISLSCQVDTTSSQRYFYYCCTDGEPEVTVFNSLSYCYRIDFCTMIVSDENKPSPSVAFFGETLPVYVDLYGHPIPNLVDQPRVTLHYGTTGVYPLLDNLTSSFQTVYSRAESSLITRVFNVQVPDIDSVMYGKLDFSVTFETAADCRTTNRLRYMINVVRLQLQGPTTATATPETFTTAVPSTNTLVFETGYVIGLAVALGVVSVICAIESMLLLVGCCIYVIRRRCFRKSSGQQLSRPYSLRTRPYGPLNTSSSVTPTPISEFDRHIASSHSTYEDIPLGHQTASLQGNVDTINQQVPPPFPPDNSLPGGGQESPSQTGSMSHGQQDVDGPGDNATPSSHFDTHFGREVHPEVNVSNWDQNSPPLSSTECDQEWQSQTETVYSSQQDVFELTGVNQSMSADV